MNWARPRSRLQLEASATVAGDVITYAIYPRNVGGRMWDLKINVPLPEGTTFLSAGAPSPFVANFDGREVSFFILELARQAEVEPVRFKVSTDGVTTPFVMTHAWATWKNVGRQVGLRIAPQEEIRTGDIIVQPHASQSVVSDMIGDVPFANYDLTSIALEQDGTALKIIFYTAGDLDTAEEPLLYLLYIDNDCRLDTGSKRHNRGVEYQVRYGHDKGQALLFFWDPEEKKWRRSQPSSEVNSLVSGNMVTVWVPDEILEAGQQFCWVGEARNRTKEFYPNLPPERAPNSNDLRLTQYEVLAAPPAIEAQPAATGPLTNASGNDSNPGDITSPNDSHTSVTMSPPASPVTGISGKLAVPLGNGQILYDVHIFSLPDGQEIAKIANTRQPNFRFDGQRILINREGGGVENLYEFNLADGTEKQISDAPQDWHPFYDPWGNRVVYGNSELIVGADGDHDPFIFVQCGLLPPHQEVEPRCRNIPWLGVLVPAGQMGEIQGTHPVWTANDMIAYKGCNSWAGFAACGIYIVPSSSTKGFSNGFIPRQLTQDTSDIPTDTKGNLIAFTSHREGNWEAYVMNLDGAGLRNLSASPNSSDGLPAISPNGNWIAFVSDRDGQWAIWVVPVGGGPVQKLFDLPDDTPWGDGDRAWTNERISWGP